MKKALSILKFLAVLYLFFLCIELMGGSFKLLGKDAARQLLQVTDNPFVGLLIGILATSIMQSSSTTTSIIVGMVAAGTLTISQAVPMIMGANIGTTITAFLAAMVTGSAGAVTIAVCHLLFNIFATALFLPLGRIPIFFARTLGRATAQRRWMAIVYVLLVFFAFPAILILVF